MEKHLIDQLSTEEQNSLNLKFKEATEADKKVLLQLLSILLSGSYSYKSVFGILL